MDQILQASTNDEQNRRKNALIIVILFSEQMHPKLQFNFVKHI